jgi:dolichyl-phosphate beta-glucosyltransferase
MEGERKPSKTVSAGVVAGGGKGDPACCSRRFAAAKHRGSSLTPTNTEAPVRLSVVVPAYNEEKRLRPTLEAWVAFFATQPYRAEVVVADDGSRDSTPDIALEMARAHPEVRLVKLDRNQGKGGAVKAGMLSAKGELVITVDADLNISPSHIPAAIETIEGGADVVAGMRSLREYSAGEKSVLRIVAGLLVQTTRRLLMLTFVRDTQAGFKMYRREAAQAIFSRTRIRSFAYDIEALYLARKLGFRIETEKVSCEFRDDSTYNIKKHLPPFLRDIWRIRLNALAGRYR